MATAERGAMFDEFVEGGARLDDADITIDSARFARWDYKGKVNPAVLALQINAKDNDGKVHEEYLSAGDLKFFVPSDDGKKAIPVGSQAKLNLQTNAVAFLVSIINSDTRGEMAAKLRATDDISVLDGLRVHVVQKAQPKRASISARPEDTNRAPSTQLQVDKIIAYPWEGGRAAVEATVGAAAPATAGNGAAGPAVSGELADTATGILLTILAEAGGSIKKGAIVGKAFNNPAMTALPAPTRNAVLGMIVKPEFLGASGQPWKVDEAQGTVSLG